MAESGQGDGPKTYREAAGEIERVISKIESQQDLDVDELAADVERAGRLIEFCRERLAKAEIRVEEVQRSLAGDSDSPEGGSSEPPSESR